MKKLFSSLLLLVASVCFAGQTDKFIFAPVCGLPQAAQEQWSVHDDTAGRMWCHGFSPCTGINNATNIAWRLVSSSTNNPTHYGIAIYDDTGASVVRAKGTYNATSNPTTMTLSSSDFLGGVTSFTLLAGHYYYQCYCAAETSGGGTFLSVYGGGFSLPQIQVFTASPRDGETDSSHRCNTSDGSPPTTMGSLTGQTFPHVMLLEFATGTP